jgi:hypothetical protein
VIVARTSPVIVTVAPPWTLTALPANVRLLGTDVYIEVI